MSLFESPGEVLAIPVRFIQHHKVPYIHLVGENRNKNQQATSGLRGGVRLPIKRLGWGYNTSWYSPVCSRALVVSKIWAASNIRDNIVSTGYILRTRKVFSIKKSSHFCAC